MITITIMIIIIVIVITIIVINSSYERYTSVFVKLIR